MSELERHFLRVAGEELAKVKLGGPAALATLLEIVGSWHGNRVEIGFHDLSQRWLIEGTAKNLAADRLLRDLFGLGYPGPRSGA
ncbi:hypothetical protein D3C78_1703450 [compost metagenome]